jgi:RHS repeat-associated protein
MLTDSMCYDQSGRLTSATTGGATTIYGYDDAGNRNRNGSTTATYNARNQLVSQGGTTYGYTARGTLSSTTTGNATTNSSYDAYNQLASDGTNSYTHDGLGRMLTSGPNAFTYDGTSPTLTGDGTHTYSRGPDGSLLAVGSGSQTALAFTDAHGDLSATFTAGGTTLDGSTTYDPYGQPTAHTGASYGLGYQGGWTSPTTGDVATASRWYDPGTATFTSQDTQLTLNGPAVTANQYAYGNDDPLDNVDPTGNNSCNPHLRPSHKQPSHGHTRHRGSSGRPSRGEPSSRWAGGYDDGHEAWALANSAEQERWANNYDGGEDWAIFQDAHQYGGNVYSHNDSSYGGIYGSIGGELGGEIGGIFGFSAGSCDEPVKPKKSIAEGNVDKTPINGHPEGQVTGPGINPQPGTKTAATGASDQPVNMNTEAEQNPALQAGEEPFQGAVESESYSALLQSSVAGEDSTTLDQECAGRCADGGE